jgi:hypothetical protein
MDVKRMVCECILLDVGLVVEPYEPSDTATVRDILTS